MLNIQSIILIAVLITATALAVVFALRHKSFSKCAGCNGDCAHCHGNFSTEKGKKK